jgi:hypothetical protein
MTSFDPSLSRRTAALLALGAALAIASVLHAAHQAPAAKPTVPTGTAVQP